MVDHFKVAIIGAGPGGLGAATNAAHHGLSHILFEKSEIGNTIFDYQLRKHVMDEPGKLPLRSKVGFEAGTREEVLKVWNDAIESQKVNVKKAEVTGIVKEGGKFTITFGSESITANYVVLAIGLQGSPRKLGVPGSEVDHVAYTLSDPDAFEDEDILVVGAGDAAIENAVALCEKNRVSILNRKDEFARAKDGNVALITKAIETKKLRCFYNSEISRIEGDQAFIETAEKGEVSIKATRIIARIGAIMPRRFLESCGIEFPNADMNSVPVVNRKYECNVKGLHIVGALIGYPLIKQAINQGYEVIEHLMGNDIEPADQVLIDERLEHLPGDVAENFQMIRDRVPLFQELSDPQFREMIIDSTVRIVQKGDAIFTKNDYTDTFFNIIKGSIVIEIPDGSIELHEGEFFGEMSLLSGRRRNATVLAAEEGLLLETPRKQMLKLISSVDDVKDQIDRRFMSNVLVTTIFPDVDKGVIQDLVSRVKTKQFKKGEVLFQQGDMGDNLYVIRKGSVKISRLNERGVDIAQKYLPAGHFVGEMALLQEMPTPRSATVTAAVGCEVIEIVKEDFISVLEKNPEVKKRISQVAEERRIENIMHKQDEYAGSLLDFMLGEGISDAENVLLIDSDLCIGCDNCESACAATHGGTSRLDRKGGQSFASIQVPVSCRHCENPLCMLDCPPDALTRMPDGEVIIQDSCIGCGNCVSNCPYGVIQMVYDKPVESFSLLGLLGFGQKKRAEADTNAIKKAGKCDMCGKLQSGPACVRSCPTGAAMRVNPSTLAQIVSNKQGKVV